MATTPDERPERQGKVRELIGAARVAASKDNLWHRIVVSIAVFGAIGPDRPGTSVAVAALLFVYLGRK
jgi:hypothetical protein